VSTAALEYRKENECGVAGVPGFFDYNDLYNRVVDEAPPGSWLVEVGVYHGLSLRHLAHAAKAADKNLTVVGIDWGRGSPEVMPLSAVHSASVVNEMPCGNLASPMLATLITAGVADDCEIILAPSVKGAKYIPDGSCAMVFLDADHSYNAVIADIRAYLPKIMPGGIICGHDYFYFPSVRNAVNEVFGHSDHMSRESQSCWEVRL
jgi:cephalosporin hydroxylase